MTPTKFLFGQIILVFLVVVFTTWAATQWAADMFVHQVCLGSAWLDLNNVSIYCPHRLYQWWYAYDAYVLGHVRNPEKQEQPLQNHQQAMWVKVARKDIQVLKLKPKLQNGKSRSICLACSKMILMPLPPETIQTY